MSVHTWCRDIPRDEAVRASEDGRSGPLPTLEECIERQKHAAMTAGVKEGFVKADGEWKRLTDDELRQILMIPKTASESSAVEQENKGNDMRPPTTKTATFENDFAKPAKGSPSLSETGEGQSGMRTERVVLEIQTHSPLPVSEWGWQEIVDDSNVKMVAFSVRVVDEERLPPTIIRLTDEREAARCERDAAIRERDEHKARVDYLELDRKNWCDMSGLHERQANALRARVAKLESAAKLAPAANADGISNHAAPAASGGGDTPLFSRRKAMADAAFKWCNAVGADRSPLNIVTALFSLRLVVAAKDAPAASGAAGTEPVAWMCEWTDHTSLYDSKTQAEIDSGGEIVPQPLYRSPPQAASGWLTAEDREWLTDLLENVFISFDADEWIRSILARSSPPEVVLPELHTRSEVNEANHKSPCLWLRRPDVIEALAAAGVKVKEVGK